MAGEKIVVSEWPFQETRIVVVANRPVIEPGPFGLRVE